MIFYRVELYCRVKATLVVNDGQDVTKGQTLVKIQKDVGKSRDITGGLPRVAELFEARKPANPAVVTEINGTVEFGDCLLYTSDAADEP